LIVSRIDVAIPAAGSIARLVDGCPIGVGLGMTLLARQIPKRGLGEPAGAIFVDVLSPVARPSGVQAGRKSICGREFSGIALRDRLRPARL